MSRKYHSYTSLAYTNEADAKPEASAVDDAREAFLVELASFHLSLQKSLMVCEAEARQVEEYQRERERIGEPCPPDFVPLHEPPIDSVGTHATQE